MEARSLGPVIFRNRSHFQPPKQNTTQPDTPAKKSRGKEICWRRSDLKTGAYASSLRQQKRHYDGSQSGLPRKDEAHRVEVPLHSQGVQTKEHPSFVRLIRRRIGRLPHEALEGRSTSTEQGTHRRLQLASKLKKFKSSYFSFLLFSLRLTLLNSFNIKHLDQHARIEGEC